MKIEARPWTPQDLIEDLQDIINEESKEYLNTRRTTLEMALVYLKEHFAEQTWIPVTERLPEKDGKYLVHRVICNGVSTMSVAGFAHKGKNVHEYDLRKHKNVWYDYDGEVGYYPLSYVIHWLPLPEPPKEE